jgi:hypothetical protein
MWRLRESPTSFPTGSQETWLWDVVGQKLSIQCMNRTFFSYLSRWCCRICVQYDYLKMTSPRLWLCFIQLSYALSSAGFVGSHDNHQDVLEAGWSKKVTMSKVVDESFEHVWSNPWIIFWSGEGSYLGQNLPFGTPFVNQTIPSEHRILGTSWPPDESHAGPNWPNGRQDRRRPFVSEREQGFDALIMAMWMGYKGTIIYKWRYNEDILEI